MFIDFEGIDGSGKTTLSNRLAARLRERGLRVCHAREGGELASPTAEHIRALTRDIHHLALCETAELLLYAAREAQTVDEVIRPALARGEWVISDRYVYSHLTLAREGRGLPESQIAPVLRVASGDLQPDLVVFVDVEPAIARARKRCQKVRDHRSGSSSRKGQAGAGLPVRVRRGFYELALAAPDRWIILDNTWTSLQEAEEAIVRAVLERLEGKRTFRVPVAAEPPWAARPAESLSDEASLRRAAFEAIDALVKREPRLAAYFLAGLSGPEADERRRTLAQAEPAIIAYGLRDAGGEDAWELRKELAEADPRYVARSLAGHDDERSFALRLRLAQHAPGEVARSLAGLFDERSMALRIALAEAAPDEVLVSLGGLDRADAWALRERLRPLAAPEALAASVRGLDCEAAWRVREALAATVPLAVVESLRGVGGERAHEQREHYLRRAPRAVLESLEGLDDSNAWRVREAVAERMREAVASTVGLDSPRAWSFREKLASMWPAASLRSLLGLARTVPGSRMLFDIVRRHSGDFDVLRGVAWVLDPARRTPAAGGGAAAAAG